MNASELPLLTDPRSQLGADLVVFLDFDGTLSPIVDDPSKAMLSASMRNALRDIACRFPTAIVSGRDRRDVASRVGIESLVYAGSHGFDIAGPGIRHTLSEADSARAELANLAQCLGEALANFEGIALEPKTYSLAVHYRHANPNNHAAIQQGVEHAIQGKGLRVRPGKMVLDIQPDLDWHKGRAVKWLIQALKPPASAMPVYFGDDLTDEDAFRAISVSGFGVLVGDHGAPTSARFRLPDVKAVEAALRALCG